MHILTYTMYLFYNIFCELEGLISHLIQMWLHTLHWTLWNPKVRKGGMNSIQ